MSIHPPTLLSRVHLNRKDDGCPNTYIENLQAYRHLAAQWKGMHTQLATSVPVYGSMGEECSSCSA